MPRAYVLYHANCYDGFSAAWVAWQALGDDAKYIPATYGQPIPDIPDGTDVYLLDFSYSLPEMLGIQERATSLTILDHHKTARDALLCLDPQTSTDAALTTTAVFDMNKSGAVLAWEYFFPDKLLPPLLAYVQDRDLWRWELPMSREVSAALHAYPFDFSTWSLLAIPRNTEALKTEGIAIERFKTKQVKMICDQAHRGHLGGHFDVPIVNATAFWSEVGEELLARYSDAPMVASWFVRADGQMQWSLRSRPDFDCASVARSMGGGGHPQAAGFVGDGILRDGRSADG